MATGRPDRRNPDLLALDQLALGLGAAAINPNLAGAQQTVNVRLGDARKLTNQEVIDALPVFPGADGNLADLGAILCQTMTIRRYEWEN